MNLKFALIVLAIVSSLLFSATGPVHCERTLSLTVCQELVNSARGYEARSSYHNRVAKAFMMQIENMAKQPKNQGTVAAMDSLFHSTTRTGYWSTSSWNSIGRSPTKPTTA